MVERVPSEILLHIFTHFGPAEIGRQLMPVCKSWNKLLRDDQLWITMFRRHVKQQFHLELIATSERPYRCL